MFRIDVSSSMLSSVSTTLYQLDNAIDNLSLNKTSCIDIIVFIKLSIRLMK